MADGDFDIHYVARLARLELSEEEEATYGRQLNDILGYVKALEAVDVAEVTPTAHAVPLVNVTRSDEVRPSMDHALAMQNAPSTSHGLFIVPKIVE